MAHTLTVLTLWLAQAIGLYLIASAGRADALP